MQFHRIIRFSLLVATFIFTTNTGGAQIYGPFGSVDYSAPTGYGEDTIFVFHSGNPDKIIGAAHSTSDTSSFRWSRFNKETHQFDSLFTHFSALTSKIKLDSLYETGMLQDTVEGLRVKIKNDEDSIEYYTSWVVMDTFPDIGDIQIENNNCYRLWLSVNAFNLKNYVYYNLTDSEYDPMTLENDRTVEWNASEDVDIYDNQTLYTYGNKFIGKLGQVGTFESEMPYKDSDYYLEVTNTFGNTGGDTIENVIAKAVKADFSVIKVFPDGTEEDYEESNINEALLQVKFENKSKNADRYHWLGYNDSLLYTNGRDTILWENRQEAPSVDSVPRYSTGKYRVKLITENEYGCIDSMSFYHIKVDSSKIDTSMIPNVFTPNGDGTNELFVLPKRSNITDGQGPRGIVSMKKIEVTILNRNGELVYQYKGNPDDWEGWDGKVKNSNRDAAEGVYVYVIVGRGYDGVSHESKKYTGILYLYR